MKLKAYLAVGLLGCLLIFVLQNTEMVSIRFLIWQFTLSRALLVLVIFLAGILGGYLLGSLAGHRRRKGLPPRSDSSFPS